MSELMKSYLDRIEKAERYAELDDIVEEAAGNDDLTNPEYEGIVYEAHCKVYDWRGF